MPVPVDVRTARLVLRPWRADDAEALLPVLDANREHLLAWIPARVAEPTALPRLRDRLAAFADAFAAAREWRYGIFAADDGRALGELSLFPRDGTRRVAFAEADRVEIGYWLRADATGQGLATEAAQAALTIAAAVPRFRHAEIRCDARNLPSAAVPRRLGFILAATEEHPGATPDDPPVTDQVWRRALGITTRAGGAPGMSAEIVPYRREFAEAFDRLNREWLERFFTVEPLDEAYLRDPEGKVIAAGGEIFFAIRDGEVIGTCAAVPQGEAVFELAKLCVTPAAQGGGLGHALCRRVIGYARDRGARRVVLVSATRLGPALRLYERLGFVRRPFPGARPYVDADVYMELELVD